MDIKDIQWYLNLAFKDLRAAKVEEIKLLRHLASRLHKPSPIVALLSMNLAVPEVLTHILLPVAALYIAYPAMASFLRSLIAGPRVQHEETGLDLCYVHSNPTIIAMSMPASDFPKKAYRNPLDQVVKFLDSKHGDRWSIWEFRAEGTGYNDEEFYGKVFHAPWPDHHPPPFALIPLVLASMRNHLKGGEDMVAVVHCKAGKGRSGTVACSYLIGEEGISAADALAQFTAARMRPGFGEGISIPSQLRWISYVDRWANELNKTYTEQLIEIQEVQVWGLREGVKVAVQGYVDEGKEIKTFHTFHKKEKTKMSPLTSPSPSPSPSPSTTSVSPTPIQEKGTEEGKKNETEGEGINTTNNTTSDNDVIFKPTLPLILPTNDINIDFEKRNKAAYGWTVVTSIAHVWFNAYFESLPQPQTPPTTTTPGSPTNTFEITWEQMDGIKGTLRKGIKAFDKLRVTWSVYDHSHDTTIAEPKEGEPIPQPRRASTHRIEERELGITKQGSPASSESEESASVGPVVDEKVTEVKGKKELGTEAAAAEKEAEVVVGAGAERNIGIETLPVVFSEEPYTAKKSHVGAIKQQR